MAAHGEGGLRPRPPHSERARGQSRAPGPLPPAGRRVKLMPATNLCRLSRAGCTESTTTRGSTGSARRSRCGLASELHSSHAAVNAVILPTPVAEDRGGERPGWRRWVTTSSTRMTLGPRGHVDPGPARRPPQRWPPAPTAEPGLGAGERAGDERRDDRGIGDLAGKRRGEEQRSGYISRFRSPPPVERNRNEDRAPASSAPKPRAATARRNELRRAARDT